MYREITTVKTVTLCKTLFFHEKSKNQEKKVALTSFYYVNLEIWLLNSGKPVWIDQCRFYIFSCPPQFKNV